LSFLFDKCPKRKGHMLFVLMGETEKWLTEGT